MFKFKKILVLCVCLFIISGIILANDYEIKVDKGLVAPNEIDVYMEDKEKILNNSTSPQHIAPVIGLRKYITANGQKFYSDDTDIPIKYREAIEWFWEKSNSIRDIKGGQPVQLRFNPKENYSQGENIVFDYELINPKHKGDVKITYPSGFNHNVIIRNQNGKIVKELNSNRGATMAMRTVTIKAGESKKYSVKIENDLPKGKYEAELVVLANEPANLKKSFSLTVDKTTTLPIMDDTKGGQKIQLRFNPKENYSQGENIVFDYELINPKHKGDVKITYPSGFNHNVIIRNQNGKIVKELNSNRGATMAMRTVTIKAGESKKYSVKIENDLPKGKYEAELVVLANEPANLKKSFNLTIDNTKETGWFIDKIKNLLF
ncbi:MAG: BsuPI-related putative proteinase inhibitor [Candidatus Woesearchaeota archaeon]